jgi:hypothetical protein
MNEDTKGIGTHRSTMKGARVLFQRHGVAMEEKVENGQEKRTFLTLVSIAIQRKSQMLTLGKRVLELSEKDRLQCVNCRKTMRLLQRASRTVTEPVLTTSVGEPLQNSFRLYEKAVGAK